MLSKKNRLTRRFFSQILKKSKPFSSINFIIRVIPAPDGFNRFSFVAGIKVSKKSTARNLLRRRGYAAAAKILPRLSSRLWIAVFFKPSALKKTLPELESELAKILLK